MTQCASRTGFTTGQGSGDTETGAYTLVGTITRNGGAKIFLPSENEWCKAAYYSPGGVYFDYPTGTDTQTVCATPTATANRANCNFAVSAVTNVGAYTGSASPCGTFDQGGNVWEWNEQIVNAGTRGYRSGDWIGNASYVAGSFLASINQSVEGNEIGFRVARPIAGPPPVPIGDVAGPVVAALLVMTGLLGIAYRQRRHGRAA